jgi:hypothetical protein
LAGQLKPGWPDWAIFRPWVIVYFLQFFFNAEAARIFGLLFSQVKAMHYIWREMGCAIFWAIFFTNSSGHPV